MSLKVFHVFFIVLSVLCTLGFAAWVMLAPQDEATETGLHFAGAISAVLGLGLAIYGYWFVTRKASDIIV
ncbi:MAG: hypothetical protein ACC661_06130 [Verrucomicrobiales bacterium]